MGIEETLRHAQACHVRGELAQAEEGYGRVLASDPQSVAALEGLGVLVFQQGHAERALELFGRAVALNAKSCAFAGQFGRSALGRQTV